MVRYWPTRSETFVAREVAELARRGHEVVVAAIGSRPDGEGLPPLPGVAVWRPDRGVGDLVARALGPATAGERWLAQHQRPKDVARCGRLASWAASHGFDRVHAHFAGEAAEWARVVADHCGVPWSVTAHATDLFRPRPSLPELLRAARPVVTVCEHHRRWLRAEHGVEAALARCGVVPGEYPAARPGPPDGPLRAISVARWVAKKGLDTLLEAVELVPEPVRLRLVADLPGGVGSPRTTSGAVAPDGVPALLAAADVFALPCRVAPDGDRDGVPVALIEAMAAGLPVITTPVSGIPELVDDAVGWLVPPDDAEALARALREALDPAERAARGAAGRARVQGAWTVGHQVDALIGAWSAA